MSDITVTEAAYELRMTRDELLAFDQTLTADSLMTESELEQVRHVLANLDESGAYIG